MAAGRAFYAAAFGWEFNDDGPFHSGIRRADGCEAGGLRHDPDAVAATGAMSLVTVSSASLDASAAAERAAGGQVTEGPYAFPGRRRVHFTDVTGNPLAVWGA